MPTSSLDRFRAALRGALAHLESRRQEINDLNVFPVADGDTGDNMVLTLQACLDEIDRLAESAGARSLDEIGRTEIVDSVARSALLGARGNSGVILSQMIRGIAEELISRPGELVDPMLVGAAMAKGAQRAYASVRLPAEGTMLTVMRDMAAAVASEIAHGDLRLAPDTSPRDQDLHIADVLEKAVRAGEESVERGPDLLPQLREAGVVFIGPSPQVIRQLGSKRQAKALARDLPVYGFVTLALALGADHQCGRAAGLEAHLGVLHAGGGCALDGVGEADAAESAFQLLQFFSFVERFPV